MFVEIQNTSRRERKMPQRSLTFKYKDEGYERVSAPNYARLAEFSRIAMGKRTLSAFAKDSGLSIATISRVLNQKFTTPIADGIIKAISDAAEPGSIAPQAFIAAHGLEKKDDLPVFARVDELYFQKEVGEVICKALQQDGFQAEIRTGFFDKVFSDAIFDYEIETDAFAEYGIIGWCFDVVHMNGIFNREQMITKFNSILAAAYLNGFLKSKRKVSIITDTPESLDFAREKFDNHPIDDLISVVYVEPTTWEVIDEYQLPIKIHNNLK